MTLRLTKEDIDRIHQIRSLVQNTHWTQNTYSYRSLSCKTYFCLTGMINHVTGTPVSCESTASLPFGRLNLPRERIIKAFEQTIVTTTGHWYPIEDWNDSKAASSEDVLQLIDQVLHDFTP